MVPRSPADCLGDRPTRPSGPALRSLVAGPRGARPAAGGGPLPRRLRAIAAPAKTHAYCWRPTAVILPVAPLQARPTRTLRPWTAMVALAQPAEQRTVDPQVTGSTPVGHPNSPRDGLPCSVMNNRWVAHRLYRGSLATRPARSGLATDQSHGTGPDRRRLPQRASASRSVTCAACAEGEAHPDDRLPLAARARRSRSEIRNNPSARIAL